MLNKMNSKDLANFYEIENISQYMCCAHQNKSISKKDMVHNDKKFSKKFGLPLPLEHGLSPTGRVQ